MKYLLLLLCASLLSFENEAIAEPVPGHIAGGKEHALPDWFKQSFLDLREDVAEARQSGRDILVFMDLDGCPYCARTIDENFRQGPNKDYIKSNFDVIAVNIMGAREVTWLDGVTYTEQDLANHLKVFGTPSLVFIDQEGKKALQLNGYRSPQALRTALEYVHTNAYLHSSLAEFTEQNHKKPVYTLLPHPDFQKISNFAHYLQPMVLIFEDRDCTDCNSFHKKVLNHSDVLRELAAFRVVRLDAYAETPITDITGQATTPRKWADSLGMTYRPGVIFFDEGKEVARLDGRFYHFHFKEVLRFVSGKYYKRYPSFETYLAERQKALLERGVTIDLSE